MPTVAVSPAYSKDMPLSISDVSSEKIFHNEPFDPPVDFSCLLARSISFQYNGGI